MFFWQSPAADRWSLSSFLTFHYALTLSLCNVIFYAMCVSCKNSTPSAHEAGVWVKCGARHWSRISAGLLCQLPEPVESPCQQLEWVGTPDPGMGIMRVPKKQLMKGTGWARWVRDLAKPEFLVPAAGKQLSASSQNCVYDVCTHKLILSCTCWRVGGLGLERGLRCWQGLCRAVISVPMGQVCDCCTFVASTELGQLESKILQGGEEGLGSEQG